MRFILTATLCFIISIQSTSQLVILDFETPGGYTTDISESSDGSNAYFIRSDGSNIGSQNEYFSPQGSFFFAVQNHDDAPTGSTTPDLMVSGIDITGYTSITICFDLAEDDADDGNEDWDSGSEFRVRSRIDGGTETKIFQVADSGGTNSEPAVDTNFDGTGDGAKITNTFTTYCAEVPGTGNLLDLTFEFRDLNTGDEDLAIDNITIDFVLPVIYSAIAVEHQESQNILTWSTSSEVNNDYFQIEHSTDGEKFTSLGRVKGRNNLRFSRDYSFEHHDPMVGRHYYRLRQVDYDGTESISDIISVLVEKVGSAILYPTVSSDIINLRQDMGSNVTLQIINSHGLLLRSVDNLPPQYQLSVQDIPSGMYFFRLFNDTYTKTLRLIVN